VGLKEAVQDAVAEVMRVLIRDVVTRAVRDSSEKVVEQAMKEAVEEAGGCEESSEGGSVYTTLICTASEGSSPLGFF
jgi:hypothetical protein